MTGPEHYRAAENALGLAHNDLKGLEGEAAMLAVAQVHATLALAAATALYDGDLGSGADREYQQWRRIAGSEVTP
jgi:hypothetical protein